MHMNGRYARNAGMISGDEQKLLSRKRVFVAGCGGIGGYTIEHLVRTGVGHIICVDHGQFEPSNLNRQILCDMRALGLSKADCAKARAASVNPGVSITAQNVHLAPSSLPGLICGCDLAVDALDSAETRLALAAACEAQGMPIIHAAVGGWLAQAAFVPPGGGLYRLIYPENNLRKQESGVLSFAPGFAASLQAAIAVRYLCGRPCDADLHIYNLQTMQYSRVRT